MTTKSQAYDHPAYQVPVVYSGSSTAGANGVTTKFAAFTAQKIKSVTLGINVASTSATQPVMYVKSGTSTTTSTLSAITSAAVDVKNNALDVTLAQGDQFWVAHGTDATVVVAAAVESYVIPGANLTA